jgi:hypothetical protein
MTDMATDNNHKSITLDCRDGKRWTAEFTGLVTRRDLNYLRRVLTVEYAKHERRRRIAKGQIVRKAVISEENPIKAETTESVKETPKNVYKP